MKIRLLSLILLLFTFSFSTKAQTLFTENFDYPAGDSIGAHGWVAFSGSANNMKVVSPGLTYTGYSLSGIGNACRVSNNGMDNYKPFTGDSITSGSVYVAFMVKIDTAKTGDYFFTMNPPTSNTTFDPRVLVKDSAGTLSFGLSKGPNAATPSYGANGFSYGTTYLIIVKYKFLTGSTTDDELYLYVLTSPSLPSTEPVTPYLGPFTSSTNDIPSLSKVVIRQGSTASAPSLTIDGMKVATSWTSIVTSLNNITTTVPSEFTLSQNYPNPFNPVTNIRFAIPSNGFVTMKVYNTLGKEVSNLVNQNLASGSYEVKFDASTLTSGMYFYTMNYINSDGKSFTDTKKLMLVK